MTMPEQPQRAPDATLKCFGHGRELNFGSLGVPAVLVCVARESSEQAGPCTGAIRERYGEASQVMIVSVADVRSIPKLLRKVVEQLMKSSYNDAVKNLKPGRTPEEYVLIAPDFDGEVLNPLGIESVAQRIAVVVLAADGSVALIDQSEKPAEAALGALEKLIAKGSARWTELRSK
jgi:hypothetical protein